jgi:hypothetical protein
MTGQELDRAFRRSVFVELGEEGLEQLDDYGARREREGAGAGWLSAGLLVVITASLWPWISEALRVALAALAAQW